MMHAQRYDVVIIGGGIIGLATAMALKTGSNMALAVLEAEDRLAQLLTWHNSGVIHSGIYYRPGSLNARNCVVGRRAMYEFCQQHSIAHERCGKLVVATDASELPALDELERRSQANGLEGICRLGPEQIREYEPHTVGIAGLLVPETGIIDHSSVSGHADIIRKEGGEIRPKPRSAGCRRYADELVLETSRGRSLSLPGDALASTPTMWHVFGVDPRLQIVPSEVSITSSYRAAIPGEEFDISVPDPPSHFSGCISPHDPWWRGSRPNAVLAFKREGYSWRISLKIP
jgi:L-2-hydroxyglutarate oxidase